MHWNIRVVKYSEDDETILEVAEVFYNQIGKPCGFHLARASGESIDELHQYTDWMKEALALPILEFNKDFGDWDK
jgi:hypothetical protein